jgi:hypothetical protein
MGKKLQREEKDFVVEVLGVDYAVMYDGGMDEPHVGVADSRAKTITLRTGMDQQLVASTLLHEVIEIINEVLGLSLRHSQICGLEIGLMGALRKEKKK